MTIELIKFVHSLQFEGLLNKRDSLSPRLSLNNSRGHSKKASIFFDTPQDCRNRPYWLLRYDGNRPGTTVTISDAI